MRWGHVVLQSSSASLEHLNIELKTAQVSVLKPSYYKSHADIIWFRRSFKYAFQGQTLCCRSEKDVSASRGTLEMVSSVIKIIHSTLISVINIGKYAFQIIKL